MGYFSRKSLEVAESFFVAREQECREHELLPRREKLEYHLHILRAQLQAIDASRPHDRLHAAYDRCFFSDVHRHYYEDPQTVQDILYAIHEIEDILQELDSMEQQNRFARMRQVEKEELSAATNGQFLMISYWDYAHFFREAQIYRKAIPVLRP